MCLNCCGLFYEITGGSMVHHGYMRRKVVTAGLLGPTN
jgi:hypothetical protein